MSDIDDLVAISRYAGHDVLLAQGGGGNTSVKSADGARMWIKASGLRLAEVRDGHGYLETNVAALRALLADPALAALPRAVAHSQAVARTQAASLGVEVARPSLETTFHALLGRVVLHTHPVYVNAFACMSGGESALAEALRAPLAWVPYATPGYALGRAVAAVVEGAQPPAELVLANHGLIASGSTAAETVSATERLTGVAQAYFGDLPGDACDRSPPPAVLTAWAAACRAALERRYRPGPNSCCVRPATRRAIQAAAAEPEALLLGGPLVPDDVVYGGQRVWATDAARTPEAWLDEAPEAWPAAGRLILALRGLGVVLAGPSDAFVDAMEENLLAHILIRRLIARRGVAQPLLPDEIDYLLSMESEKYRQIVASGQL